MKQRSMSSSIDSSTASTENESLITGTIKSAMDTTGNFATNKNVINRIRESVVMIRERKWSATCRGILEFLSPTEFSKPDAKVVWKRLSMNTQYFLTNYVATGLIIFSFTILTSPWLFFGMLMIGYLWFMAARQESIKIGKFRLQGNRKFGALCIFTVIAMLLLGFHQTIFVTTAISSATVFLHAIFHKVPDAMNEVEDDLILLGSNIDNV